MPHPFLIVSQSDYLIQIVDIDLHTEWQTVQIQFSWLLQKPTDLGLHSCKVRVYPGSAGLGLRNTLSAESLGGWIQVVYVLPSFTRETTFVTKGLRSYFK